MNKGDTETPLVDLGDLVSPHREKVNPGDLSPTTAYLSLDNIGSWQHEVSGARQASDVRSSKTPFSEGDVLYGRMRPYLNKVCVAPFDGICSTEILVLRTPSELDAAYLVRFLGQPAVVEYSTHHSTGDLPRITFSKLAHLRIPLPPVAEQRRIVTRIDAVGSLVAGAKRRVERSTSLMKQAEAALLGQACRGTLTADVRPEGTSHDSTDEGPFDLPGTWGWVALEDLLREKGLSYGILKPGDPDPKGVPMLRVVDIGDGAINPESVVRVSPKLAAEYKRTKLEPGDVVLAVMATIGRAAVVPPAFKGANVNRALAVIKPSSAVEPEYLLAVIRSPFFQQAFASKRLGSAQARINLGDLREFPVPVPPIDEQREIVKRIQAWKKQAETVERHLTKATELVDSSFRGAAVKAFRATPLGEIVD